MRVPSQGLSFLHSRGFYMAYNDTSTHLKGYTMPQPKNQIILNDRTKTFLKRALMVGGVIAFAAYISKTKENDRILRDTIDQSFETIAILNRVVDKQN